MEIFNKIVGSGQYYNLTDTFSKSRRGYCLVYYGLSHKIDNPSSVLMNRRRKRPIKINSVIGWINDLEYILLCMVKYDSPCMISKCDYFNIDGVTPYMLMDTANQMLWLEEAAIILGSECTLTYPDIDNSDTIGIKSKISGSIKKRKLTRLDPPAKRIATVDSTSEVPTWQIISPRDKIDGIIVKNKSMEDRDMTPRYNHYCSIMDVLDINKHAILHGPTGLGKTSLIKFLMDFRVLIVDKQNIHEDLKDFDITKHDAIIFENIDFTQIPNSQILYLIRPGNQTIRYNNKLVTIPAHIKMFFTTTIENGLIFDPQIKSAYQWCQRLEIREKTFYEDKQMEEIPSIYVPQSM